MQKKNKKYKIKRNHIESFQDKQEKDEYEKAEKDVLNRFSKKKFKDLDSPNKIFDFPFKYDKNGMPDEEIIKKNRTLRKINYKLYDKILIEEDNFSKININKKYIFDEDTFSIEEITGDGNCFFRSISKFLTGEESYYSFFRNITYKYIMNNYDHIISEFPLTVINYLKTNSFVEN